MTTTPLAGSTFFGLDISGLGEQLTSMSRQLSKRVLLLEFGNNFLRLSETSITPNGVQLNHISRIELPPEALERGVPAEPSKMAELLQEICREKKIRAHRAAVVLPTEVGFQRLVDLPEELDANEAREYVQEPKNNVQIPFPLAQTDFDLSPVLSPPMPQQKSGRRLYLLTAIPQLLLDRVVEMLKIANFELQLLELGSLSQLRVLAHDLTVLPSHQIDLILELLPNCSDLLMVTSSGLLASERLSSIREFPDPELDQDQVSTAIEAGMSAESFTIKDESYLPLSDLDLRVLISDFKKALSRFYDQCPQCEIRSLQLVGINSAHPLLVKILQEQLEISVQSHRPLLSPGVSGFSLDSVLVQAGLGRLVGLGLGLLSREQLLSCPINVAKSEDNVYKESAAVAIEQLIVSKSRSGQRSLSPAVLSESSKSLSQSQASFGSAPLPVQQTIDEIQAVNVTDITNEINLSSSLDAGLEQMASVGEELKAEAVSEFKEEEEWPTIGDEELKEEASLELKEEEEEKWPTIGDEELKEEASLELKEEEEEKWPTIGDEELKEEASLELKEEEEEKWPTIAAEELKADQKKIRQDEMTQEFEPTLLGLEEQPIADESAVMSIPGLTNTTSLPAKSRTSKPLQSLKDSSTLGKLRFAESDDID